MDESNHALAALRYLVSRLDGRHFELDAGTDVKADSPRGEDEDDKRDGRTGWHVPRYSEGVLHLRLRTFLAVDSRSDDAGRS